MDITDPRITSYLEGLDPEKDSLLVEMEEYAVENDVPISPDILTRFQSVLMQAVDADRVLEVGTAIGYTAIQLARLGVEVTTIERDPEMIRKSSEYIEKACVGDAVTVLEGDARETLEGLEGSFDAVFLDAMKEEYLDYLELSLPLLRDGGVVVADNLLWFGQVATGPDSTEYVESTRALQEFNNEFLHHPRLNAAILPFGDGTGFAVKK